jgi:hypothetical protein
MVNEISLDLYVTLTNASTGQDRAQKHYFATDRFDIANRYHNDALNNAGVPVDTWKSWHADQYMSGEVPEALSGPLPAGRISLTENDVVSGLLHVLHCRGGGVLVNFGSDRLGLEKEVEMPLVNPLQTQINWGDY